MVESSNIDALIQCCADGDSSAWSKFIEHFSPLVLRTIKRGIDKLHLTFSETDTYDIYQQVFLSIWHKQKLKKIKNPGCISKWLIVVTQNETLDYIKAKQPLKETEAIDEISPASACKGGINPDLACTPVDKAHKNELEKEIEIFIEALPLKERRIATLEILYDLKYTQISKIVNLPIGTIASVIKRIKADLKQYLFKKGYEV